MGGAGEQPDYSDTVLLMGSSLWLQRCGVPIRLGIREWGELVPPGHLLPEPLSQLCPGLLWAGGRS